MSEERAMKLSSFVSHVSGTGPLRGGRRFVAGRLVGRGESEVAATSGGVAMAAGGGS